MSTWKPCGACKKPIRYGGAYWACSVSTCNRARFQLAFCSLSCWDSHVAVLNHRNAWAEERAAPSSPPGEGSDEPRRRIPRTPVPEVEDRDVLIVASKLKQYIRDRAGLHTSAAVLDVLSDIVRAEADRAIDNARRHGRKTVMAEDLR